MPATPFVDRESDLPPRPRPPRSAVDTLTGWVEWIGLARLVLAAVSVAVVGAGAFWLLRAAPPDVATALPPASGAASVPAATLPRPSPPEPEPTAAPGPLFVHVAGAVAAPGVYQLPAGSRVGTAVDAAGGSLPDGDLDALNLAAQLADGERIYVPVVGEVDPSTLPSGGAGVTTPGDPAVAHGPVDLNAASVAELEALPGVGPATAAAIVDDRTRNGPFLSVDDLDRVPGIGPSRLEALRDAVTV